MTLGVLNACQRDIRQISGNPHAIVTVVWKFPSCGQAVFRQLSSIFHQAAVRKSSGSHQVVIRQSSGSHQVVIRQSSVSHQAVIRQSSYIECPWIILHCALYYITVTSRYTEALQLHCFLKKKSIQYIDINLKKCGFELHGFFLEPKTAYLEALLYVVTQWSKWYK